MASTNESGLVEGLSTVLKNLDASPYPVLPSPESTKRRASVALVVRVNPSYNHWPETDGQNITSIEEYFAQEWVQHGDPEVLFIKRASRKGDRWTSHIAFPGGRLDPDDVDDKAAAIRETWEEVGLDLNTYAIEGGNLPQRLVTTHWGKKPLMVLCPYVFLLTSHQIPPLKLQPTEVAATHWVPLRELLSEEHRTVAFESVDSRLANQETGIRKWICSTMVGKMMFAAINLVPTESLHSFETPAPDGPSVQDNRHAQATRYTQMKALASRIRRRDVFNQWPAKPPEEPLLLWGLTLGVVADFLDLLPPHNALTLWTYPTFAPLDVRFIVWLMTYRFKNRKRAELQSGTMFMPGSTPTSDDSARRSFGVVSESAVLVHRPGESPEREPDRTDETGLHGLGSGVQSAHKKAAIATMLEGYVDRLVAIFLPDIADRGRYYDIVRKAVAVALVGRASFAVILAAVIWVKVRRRRL